MVSISIPQSNKIDANWFLSMTVSFQVTVPTNTPERPYYRRQTPQWKQEKPRWKKLPTDAKTSNVIMQIRIVRIELTTKDWKSPILPLNYIRKLNTQNRTRTYNPFIRSEVLYPIELSVHLRLITRSLFGDRKEEHHLNAPMNNKCVFRPPVKIRRTGLEPARDFSHNILSVTWLPIPPSPH